MDCKQNISDTDASLRLAQGLQARIAELEASLASAEGRIAKVSKLVDGWASLDISTSQFFVKIQELLATPAAAPSGETRE